MGKPYLTSVRLRRERIASFGRYPFNLPIVRWLHTLQTMSPVRQLAFLRVLRDLVAQGAQFIIATHSPIIMAYPGATILVCGPDGLVQTRYEDTEHVRVTRAFLDRPERSLAELFDKSDDTLFSAASPRDAR